MIVKFYLVKHSKDSTRAMIRASFCWHGKRLQISTGESINPGNWNTRRGTSATYVLRSQEWATHINQKLADIKKFAGDLNYEYLQRTDRLTAGKLRAEYRKKFLFWKPDNSSLQTAGLTILQMLEKALEFKKKTTRGRTFETYQTTFNHFTAYMKAAGLQQADQIDKYMCSDFERYLVEKFSSNATINNNTQFFTTLLNQAVKMNLLDANPFRRTVLTSEEIVNLAYSDEQTRMIMDHLDRHDKNLKHFCQFIYYSFARPIELRRIRISDINFSERILFVSGRGKNRTNRPIEILDPFMNLIEEMNLKSYPQNYYVFTYAGRPGEAPVHKNHFNYAFRDHMNELGLDSRYTMYSFKHYGVIKHFLSGYDLRWLQDQTGHKDITNLMRYLRSLGMKINRAKNQDVPAI